MCVVYFLIDLLSTCITLLHTIQVYINYTPYITMINMYSTHYDMPKCYMPILYTYIYYVNTYYVKPNPN